MTLNVEIYEMEYSTSPGGVDCWEVSIDNDWCASDFKTAGDALHWVLDNYPYRELNLNVKSLNWYRLEYENEYSI